MIGDAESVEIAYTTHNDDMGYRGAGAGKTFALWRGGRRIDEVAAVVGRGRAKLSTGRGFTPEERAIVYLPEGMRPTVERVETRGGSVVPAPAQPLWLAYGDSIAEGWISSGPSRAWPAIAGRDHGLDLHNFGYAGAARGEIASAEQLSALPADVISITHGTNCWTRTPHDSVTMRATTAAFLSLLRQGHPETRVVVVSPVVRPDAESTPNRLGATLADLRRAMEDAVEAKVSAGDSNLTLVRGAELLSPELLADGIHPGDDGHVALAAALGPIVGRC
ncbi:MAG: GDSL-type esterase/lipase family protein [Mycobacterium sp.]